MADDYRTTREEIPDRLEPFVGWRFWRMTKDGQLKSAFHENVWPAGEPIKAECAYKAQHGALTEKGEMLREPHEAPDAKCTCGIYGGNAPLPIYKMMTGSSDYLPGTALLWGRVTVHDAGWRASIGYPKLVYVPDAKLNEMRLKLQEFYPNVEVAPLSVFTKSMNLLVNKEKRARTWSRSRNLMKWVLALWAGPLAVGIVVPAMGEFVLKGTFIAIGTGLGWASTVVGAAFVKEFLTAEMTMERSDYIFGALIASFLAFMMLLGLGIAAFGFTL